MPNLEDASKLDADALQPSLVRLLRPLVYLLIRAGITFPTFMDMVRALYVNVAENDFALSKKEQTDSRISLLTGVHRKEVRRLRGEQRPIRDTPIALSLTGRILARWLGSPQFADEQGRPRPLPRMAPPDQPSFEALVMLETKDVRPRAVLDEWIDRGLAIIDRGDTVMLIATALLPRPGDPQQLHYFGRNLHDHVAAGVANILDAEPKFFDRSVHYDGLSAAVAQALVTRARSLADGALREANRDAQTACDTDAGGTWRWNFGVFVFAEQDADAPPPRPAESDPKS